MREREDRLDRLVQQARARIDRLQGDAREGYESVVLSLQMLLEAIKFEEISRDELGQILDAFEFMFQSALDFVVRDGAPDAAMDDFARLYLDMLSSTPRFSMYVTGFIHKIGAWTTGPPRFQEAVRRLLPTMAVD